MDSSNFGKDLGLMHEIVVMGRKVGFGRLDWAKIAHSEPFMRSTLDFVRRCDTSHFPTTMESGEQIEQIAKLVKLIFPFTREGYYCICCEKNENRGEENSRFLMREYEKLGLLLSEREKISLKQGGCHQPLEMTFPLIKEVLGVEPTTNNDWDVFRQSKDSASTFTLECLVTPTTSLQRIFALREAMRKEGMGELAVNLKFAPTETQ